jgi:type VI secretion system secreted protein VgrG
VVVMRNYTQKNRRIAISTPLGEDKLLLHSISGSEAISRPFHYHLELLSEDDSIGFSAIVGKRVNIRIKLADASERHFNGFISRFSQGARDGALTSYHAEMVPWLWFLTRTADCRIFQSKAVPDIIQQIFKDLGFQEYALRLYGSFAPREYCVQYRETDFNFVSRLMEECGIFYYFEHTDSEHRMILANDPAAIKSCPNQPKARYEITAGGWQDDDVITDWRKEQSVRSGTWTQTDFNFETPSTSLLVSVAGSNAMEIYDYPGEYATRSAGDELTKIRLQEDTTPGSIAIGQSVCRAFGTGYKFKLEDHYRADMNGDYILTEVRHRASQGGDYAVGSETGIDEEFSYVNQFDSIPASVLFRPERSTRRPIVQGCQTAMVVGPSGEEIYTDKYGRVKVQFHWDREGKRDENSSCWIRVSHPWAGQGWGSVAIPRIGQEVVIDFLEGDPDRPLIVGRVYNAESMPPYGLPGGAVISGVKSNSTKGGGGYNEIVMDDTKGTELIRVHAQYDKDKVVEHDERVHVKHDRTETVDHDEKIIIGHDRTENVGNNETIRTEKVGSNESITIGSNRTEKVGANETINIGSNRTETVGSNETIKIGSNRTETVGSNESITVTLTRTRNVGVNEMVNVGGAQEVTVGGAQMVTVGGLRAKSVGVNETVNIGVNQSVDVGKNQNTNIGSNQSVTIGSNRSVSAQKNDTLEVGKNLSASAGDSIVLKTGDASITMKKDGTIQIQGKNITIKGSGKINVKADGNIVLSGQKILQN